MRRSIKVTLAIGAAAFAVAGCGGGSDDDSASAGSGIVSIATVDGTDVLADAEGRTLYTADVEKDGRIRCVEACTSFWEPVTASREQAEAAAADLDVELGVVSRPEGGEQLTFNGLPLYTFAQEDAGQLEGDGFADDFRGTHFEWAAATTDGGSGQPDTRGGSGYGY